MAKPVGVWLVPIMLVQFVTLADAVDVASANPCVISSFNDHPSQRMGDAVPNEQLAHSLFGRTGVRFMNDLETLAHAQPAISSELNRFKDGIVALSICLTQRLAQEHDLKLPSAPSDVDAIYGMPVPLLTIQSARFGTAEKNYDVAWRLQDYVRNGVLRIPNTIPVTTMLGDPSPGRTKDLHVVANTKEGIVSKSVHVPWHSEYLSEELVFSNARPSHTPVLSSDKFESLVMAHVVHKQGVEIGGPSYLFQVRGIYSRASQTDLVQYTASSHWFHGDTSRFYEYDGGGRGRFFVMDGGSLSGISNQSYDFVLSCHNFEHFANPLSALSNWKRVLKDGGVVFMVLPRKEGHCPYCEDQHKSHGNIPEMLWRFFRRSEETDMNVIDVDGYLLQSVVTMPFEELRTRLMDQVANRNLHHFVYDSDVLTRLLVMSGFEILLSGTTFDDSDPKTQGLNQYIVARKLSAKAMPAAPESMKSIRAQAAGSLQQVPEL